MSKFKSGSVKIQVFLTEMLSLTAPASVIIRPCEPVNSVSYLEQDLDRSVNHAHPPAQEGEEREDELDEVVGQRLEAVKPPRGAMHVVGHGVRNRLGLGRDGGAESENVKPRLPLSL